jgi:hypothetical protein
MESPYGNIIAMARTSLGLKNRKKEQHLVSDRGW